MRRARRGFNAARRNPPRRRPQARAQSPARRTRSPLGAFPAQLGQTGLFRGMKMIHIFPAGAALTMAACSDPLPAPPSAPALLSAQAWNTQYSSRISQLALSLA